MTVWLRYDEAQNLRLLSKLSPRSRVAFALLCSYRLLPSYRRFSERTSRGDADALEKIADRLWKDVMGVEMSAEEVGSALERCMRAIPNEQDGWDGDTQAYAEDASAAVAYALRARLTGEAKEAARAARRLRDAADYFALRLPAGSGPMLFREKRDSTPHPVVQAELRRQQRDLDELLAAERDGSLAERLALFRARSEREAAEFFENGGT